MWDIFYDPLKSVFHCSLANPKVIFTRRLDSDHDDEYSEESPTVIDDQDTVELLDTFNDIKHDDDDRSEKWSQDENCNERDDNDDANDHD